MAAKPVDRIRTMITELERGARTLGNDLRKRAGKVSVTPDIESALRQLLAGLTTIASQLEKAAKELREYLEEAGGKGGGARKAKPKAKAGKKSGGKSAGKAAAKKAPAKKAAKKAAAKKAAR